MDNATAEYSFITSFFATEPQIPVHLKENSNTLSPPSLLSPLQGEFDDVRSNHGSEQGTLSRRRLSGINSSASLSLSGVSPKEEEANLTAIWKQIMDPVLEYAKVRRQISYNTLADAGLYHRHLSILFSPPLHLSSLCSR